MATVDDLLLKNKKIQLVKSRPWDYMEEMDRQDALQTGSKVVAKWEQSGSKLVAEKQETGSATGSKVVANFSFSSLIGLQKKIILFLYESCKTTRSKLTNPISLEHMSDMLKASIGTIKSAIRRLENKQLLTRAEYKNGRGGWSKYSIPEHLFQELLQIETGSKVVANWYQSDSKVVANWEQSGSKLVSELVANPPVVVVSNNNKLTNTYMRSVDNLPIDWQAINYEPVRGVGFSEATILQLYSAKRTTAKVVQESIDNFALNLQHNLTAYKSPLGALISVLNKGGVWRRIDALKPTAEPLKPIAEQEEAKQEAAAERERIEHIFHKEYCKWYDSLSNDELKQLFPAYDLSKFRYGEVETEAEEVFRKTKWMEIYNNISH